jgi:hypothetical protein
MRSLRAPSSNRQTAQLHLRFLLDLSMPLHLQASRKGNEAQRVERYPATSLESRLESCPESRLDS